MNDESSRSTPTTLQQTEELLTGKKAADLLISQYMETSDIQVPWNRKEDVKKAQQDYINTSGEPIMNSPFTVAELDTTLDTLQLKKSSSPDKITNEMLLHLGPAAKKKLLQLINDSRRTGTVPQIWKEATMVPVYKKGKD